MSENATQRASGGIGFFGLLAIVFITLKLTNVIAWSWFWVLSPVLFPLILAAVCGLFIILALMIESGRGGNPFR